MLFFVLPVRLAPFPPLQLTTIHRETFLCLHSLLSRCFALHWGFPTSLWTESAEVPCAFGCFVCCCCSDCQCVTMFWSSCL